MGAMSKSAVSGSLQVAENVVFQEIEGETVLLDLKQEQYFGLDEVGSRIWALIEGGHSVGAIVRTLGEEYDAGPQQIEHDLLCLLTELEQAGLIEQRPQGDATP